MRDVLESGHYRGEFDHVGGYIRSLKFKDQEIFYFSENGEKRGTHPCVPYFSNLKGYDYLPRHGWMRDSHLYSCHKKESGRERIHYWKMIERTGYPGSIYSSLLYELSPSGLNVYLSLWNHLEGVFPPVNPAFHPYILTGKDCLIQLGNSEVIKIDNPVNEPRFFSFSERVSVYTDNGALKMRFSGDFNSQSQIVLWSNSNSFICVEGVYGEKPVFLDPKKILRLNCAFVFTPK